MGQDDKKHQGGLYQQTNPATSQMRNQWSSKTQDTDNLGHKGGQAQKSTDETTDNEMQ